MAQGKRYEITVVPKASLLADQSDPGKNQFVFSYTSPSPYRRHRGATREPPLGSYRRRAQGPGSQGGLGVVGQQPLLKPGESFEYTSGVSIPTAVGTMRGSYQMRAEDGQTFDAQIPPFTLSVPRTLH
jgi:ApaG protein